MTVEDTAVAEVQDAVRYLHELALDVRWSWSHATDEIWRELEPQLWARTHNPWVVLRTVSRRRLEGMLRDAALRTKVAQLAEEARTAARAPAWYQQTHGSAELNQIAYFSMEFMLSEALPIYAGGLGNVAGDQLKAASDLGVPVVGVGLLYQLGYFRQVIDRAGGQEALYPYNDPMELPVTPLRRDDGEWLRIELTFPGGVLWLRTWQVHVGRLRLYLLDSNDAANYPTYRGITSELYGGGPELRLMQEIVLGIGGWRLLTALNVRPEVCHLNEGHAAFAILERARDYMSRTGQPFDTALTTTRAGNLFTTHTAVPAGFDRFQPQLIEQYLADYARDELHVGLAQLLALGRANPRDDAEPFNMAYLAVRGSGAVNAVSELHERVSRRIFLPLFPRWPLHEVPVGHITNGVHTPTWDSPQADVLWTQACGKDRWRGELKSLDAQIRCCSDQALWQLRSTARAVLLDFARERVGWQLGSTGMDESAIREAARILRPDALTLGFARRFATYKRPNLLLHDPERLIRLLSDPQRPVQLIIAGKAHPADQAGQQLIREWVQFVRRPEVRPHAVFLADYDMLLTERLVRGVDVWINTPRRPWEACGTSGMKVLVNGGLNISELDGWWAEAYTAEIGWALGDGQAHGESSAWDAAEAARLYELLEREVVPEFYARTADGVPRTWIARVRESMAQLTPRFSANRSVREYVERYYLPAATAYRRRSGNEGILGARLTGWLQRLRAGWPSLRIGTMRVETHDGSHHFEIDVQLGELDTNLLRVELYAEPRGGSDPFREPMKPLLDLERAIAGMTTFCASAPATRAASDYTPRILPEHPDAELPLEAPYILWQH